MDDGLNSWPLKRKDKAQLKGFGASFQAVIGEDLKAMAVDGFLWQRKT